MRRIAPALLLVAACGGAPVAGAPPLTTATIVPAAAPPGSITPWRYDVAVGERALSLAVEIAIPPGSWGDLEVDPRAEPFLSKVEVALGGAPFQPMVRADPPPPDDPDEATARVFRLPPCPAAGCRVRYRFALEKAAMALDVDGIAAEHDGALIAPPSAWLLRPICFPDDQAFRLHVTTAPGVGFATGLFRGPDHEIVGDLSDLPKAPFTAFGSLRLRTIDVGGERIEIAILPGDLDLSDDAAAAWIEGSARVVHDYYGRPPVPSALVILVPTGGRGIGYGRTLGNGGASVILPLGEHSTRGELDRGWELTHELLHTAFPLLDRSHDWLAEGLATYVEPLLRARRGIIPPEEAIAHLYRRMPFGLATAGGPGLDGTTSWGRVYWGGAIFCLLADVAIRERTGGKKSLDDALRGIVAAGGQVGARWPMSRVVSVGDAATGVPVLAELYAQQGERCGAIDLAALWQKLGVSADGVSVRFDDSAPLAWIRRAMVARSSKG
ncbi:MAG: hypothetical protein ABJE95_00285 [Byssovorax sp.]